MEESPIKEVLSDRNIKVLINLSRPLNENIPRDTRNQNIYQHCHNKSCNQLGSMVLDTISLFKRLRFLEALKSYHHVSIVLISCRNSL